MSSVLHRTSKELLASVNTPDFDPATWLVNPDLSAVENVPVHYWKIDGGDAVVEMDATEKAVVDAAELPAIRRAKCASIDARTEALIALGFTFAGKVFSLSSNAQKYWIGMAVGKDLLTYPLVVNTLDDTDTYSVPDATTVVSVYATAMGTVKAHLGSGTALKDQVRAATTKAEVDAVTDTR